MVVYSVLGAGRRWTDKLADELVGHDSGWSRFITRFSRLEEFIESYSDSSPEDCGSLVNCYLALTNLPRQLDLYRKSVDLHIRKAAREGRIEPKSEAMKQGKKIIKDLEKITEGIEDCFNGGTTYKGLNERVDSLRENSSSENIQRQLYSGLRKSKQGVALLQQLNVYLQQISDYEVEIVHKVFRDEEKPAIHTVRRKLVAEVSKE